ncbi:MULTISPECIES: GntR family transcriptional regulator [Roseomonadaceae]|uniref:GntR family transcriptional regulator n=1 Tax=Falsiroseomonas oleicola TaxID=2801474 RepID=A0ABS6HEZ0_9PROT|nr:GntR family transcriptional regulator [Roseomonas oleicola]MBU8546248.1 GntR family transcriptional regulator [Roseomonas oleicola]
MPRPRLAALPDRLPDLPALDRGRPAPEQIYTALRRAILRLDFAPGAPVPEPALAAQAGVSRTPVREALRRLREDGLVEIFPNLGSFVSRLSAARLEEAVALRLLLEGEAAARLAATPAQAGLLALRRVLADQRAAMAEANRDAVYALDDAFHALIFETAALPLMWSACRAARAHMERVHHAAVADLTRAAAAIAAHQAILDRIAAGDPPGARAAMETHVRANTTDFAAIAAAHPEWLA